MRANVAPLVYVQRTFLLFLDIFCKDLGKKKKLFQCCFSPPPPPPFRGLNVFWVALVHVTYILTCGDVLTKGDYWICPRETAAAEVRPRESCEP